MKGYVIAALVVFLAAGVVQEINDEVKQRPWLVESTPNLKGHSPNVPNGVVCAEQAFEDGVRVGGEKVVYVANPGSYQRGDPCPG